MARFCFYCNRELAPGESCQCRLKARENRRRTDNQQKHTSTKSEKDSWHTDYQQKQRQQGSAGPSSKRKKRRLSLSWRDLKPSISDFIKPLDQLEQEKPNMAAAVVSISVSIIMQGVFIAAVTRQTDLFLLGVLFGLVSLLFLFLLFFVRMRVRLRRTFHLNNLIASSRPVYLYTTIIYLFATLAGLGNPLFGVFLFLLGDLAAKGGLLWQRRQRSPLDRNRFFLASLLTIVVHTFFLSIVLQAFLRNLFTGF